jgi:predicted esterase YcpF (UPF0227 family)
MHHPPATTHLLYLHGFRSSPQSMKARKMADWIRQHRPDVHFCCPQLPPSPAQAMADVGRLLEAWPRQGVAVMGSSLGGFYATWVAEHLPPARHAPVVLINPAVEPARDLAHYIGEQTAWHNPQERFFFQPHFVDELRQLGQPPLTDPQRYQVWAATADEVLDWREMQARYNGCQLQVVPGSDHALSDFDQHLPLMLQHLGLAG